MKQKGAWAFTGLGKLAIIGFTNTLAFALVTTIWAVYMDSFFDSIVYVGFFSAFLTLISFASFFIFVPLIEKSDKSHLFGVSLILTSIVFSLLALVNSFFIFVLLSIVMVALISLKFTSFGIIVRDKSNEKKLSRNEGLMYTFYNLSYLIGPLIAGYLSFQFGIKVIFVLAALFLLMSFFVFKSFKIEDSNIKKKIDKNVFKNYIEHFKSKDRITAFILGGGVNLWWVLIYLFMPLYIIRQGLNEIWVGYFLFAIPIPLILFTYKFSEMAGKIGFKKIFKIGFLIPGVLAVACFFIADSYLLVMLLLILASLGFAMLEGTTEAYFFDISKKQDEQRFYGPHNTTIEINNLIGKLLSSFLLIFLPFKFIFLIFALFMFIMVYFSTKVRDLVESRGEAID